jgi:hypothetical protein
LSELQTIIHKNVSEMRERELGEREMCEREREKERE